ncbi:hypothetical protein LEQ04_04875 [Riemerella anatipestifer]|nr:hypothetical protein LEQ05_09380 [Riemerella anatipestifer]WPC14176.1 hypothetical protein LEQ03_06260 [Riemerella anatipestifer]WPC16153.1 hypothetical protein LEQ04_04875 [Riemerella anatipestifer]
MKFKILMVYGLLFSTVLWVNAQSKYTPQQVEASDDIKVIANFIKYNPDHPDTPKFKAKLYNILNGNTSNDSKKKTASTPVVVEKNHHLRQLVVLKIILLRQKMRKLLI